MQKIWVIILFVSVVIAFSLGVYSAHYQTFPYDHLRTIYKQIIPEEEMILDYDVDIQSLIHINSVDDVKQTRNNLINYIWKEQNLPTHLPNSIQKNIVDERYDNLKNLEQIDKIEIEMDYGVNSIAYHFLPKNSNEKLIIYHQGHRGDFIHGIDTIEFFLEKGYSILAFSMPLMGMNNQPLLDIPEYGKFPLQSHGHFQYIDSESFSSIQFFVEPITISLNYLDNDYSYSKYYMIGISGGGWTTILYPAIDTRISESYSVAGSVPIYLRTIPKNAGDYEQIIPELYIVANYLDQYVLNSYGEKRKLVQIFNKYDSCCFSTELVYEYEQPIKQTLNQLGMGEFKIYFDESHHDHIISNYSLEVIRQEIDND